MATKRKTPRVPTPMPTLDWVPKRNGQIFCSPACGAGCAHSDWELAHKRANALCKRLGPGWEPRVWENGAWHYMVYLGKQPESSHHAGMLELYPSHPTIGRPYYWATLQGAVQLTAQKGDSPESVVRGLLKQAEVIMGQWLAVMIEAQSGRA